MKHYHKIKQNIYIVLFLIFCGIAVQTKAQDHYAPLIQAIDSNNTGLMAYQQGGEAQKMLNKTGLTPSNPEIGVNYIKPIRFARNRLMDYTVSQNLDFPTVYGHKRSVSKKQNQIVDTDYRVFRADLVNQAINTYLNWVYYSQLGEVLRQQMEYAEGIASSYQKTFEAGGTTVLERNKAQVSAVNARKEYELNAIEQQTAYQELLRFNQGKPFVGLSPEFPSITDNMTLLFAEENQFMANNSEIEAIKQEVELGEAQEKLAKAQTLPGINVGYMWGQEFEADFRGVSLGISIPLWQQKNTRKYARLNTQALRNAEDDSRNQYTLQLGVLRNRASELYKIRNELEKTISQTRGLDLLKKALDLREITFLDYLVEQSIYFELTQKYLQTELNFHVTMAELYRWEY